MADIADEAADLESFNNDLAVKNRPIPAPRSEICRNGDCGEPSLEGTSYCSKECCEDHARELWAQRQRKVA
ncbi:hypothetical protein VH86_03830 [Pantoea sp. BL1]|nr:hypothetical protein VH86_03830 [Pantoea sp. BL1]